MGDSAVKFWRKEEVWRWRKEEVWRWRKEEVCFKGDSFSSVFNI